MNPVCMKCHAEIVDGRCDCPTAEEEAAIRQATREVKDALLVLRQKRNTLRRLMGLEEVDDEPLDLDDDEPEHLM